MLEKMGWSKGKGLGVNLDGEQNFIRVSHKTDQRGMGFVDRDDQWTQHETNFNSLLKSFDNSNAGSQAQSDDDDESNTRIGFGFASDEKQKQKLESSIAAKLSGKSLEEQSKASNSRLHYKKFTRGKDLTKYSEKDLANIFGKKSGREDETIEDEKNEIEPDELNFGITTIETGATIADYFRSKKSKTNESNLDPTDAAVICEGEKKKSKDKKKNKKNSIEVAPNNGDNCKDNDNTVEASFIAEDIAITNEEKVKHKKKKSSKKPKEESQCLSSSVSNDIENYQFQQNKLELLQESNDVSIKKQKKKKKQMSEELEKTETVNAIDVEAQSKTSKKRKRSRQIEEAVSSNEIAKQEITSVKKSKKQQSVEVTNVPAVDLASNILCALISNKKNLMGHSSTEACSPSVSCNAAIASMPPYISFGENIYEINRYQAEVFRFLDLDGFTNSNLCDLAGYGYSKNLEVKVTAKSKDYDKISGLWDHALATKYGADAVKTRKINKKNNYSIKTLKKKNVFKGI